MLIFNLRTQYANNDGPIHARQIEPCNVFAFLGYNRIYITNVSVKLKRIQSIIRHNNAFTKGYNYNVGK